MPANFADLNAAVADLATQVSTTVGVEQSATTLINGFAAVVSAAVAKALTEDDAADQGSIDAALAAIQQAKSQMLNPTNDLAAAVAANPGS